MLLILFGPNFKGKDKTRSKQGQGRVKARSRLCRGNVKTRLRQGQGKFMARSRRSLGKVKARSRIGQGKINVRLKQSNHYHNQNYNLMDFDTIEINL